MRVQHPATVRLFENLSTGVRPDSGGQDLTEENTTSVSLARALAVGCLSRLDPSLSSINIWDPSAGSGLAGFLLVEALHLAGLRVQYRGQDINKVAVLASQRRFEGVPDAVLAVGNTLAHDEFKGFRADLVIVDAPWGMDWANSKSAVEARRSEGEFGFGVPQRSDSTWLFISLALEKLRPSADGGGRVSALVNPGALSSGGSSGAVRKRIMEAGLLESVTRLPEGLAPNTSLPLHLLTFSNQIDEGRLGEAMIADLQTLFATEGRRRSMPISALRELETGLRTRRSGPRNRTIHTRQFVRREAELSRVTGAGRRLSWRLTTHNGTDIDSHILESRYGPRSGVSIAEQPRETLDLNPGRIFGEDSRELIREIEAKGWPSRRLSSFLAREPKVAEGLGGEVQDNQIFVPTTPTGKVSAETSDTGATGRILAIELEGEAVEPRFLAAWLNCEQGVSSRRRAI